MTMVQPLMVLTAVLATAFARVLLTPTSYFSIKTSAWLIFVRIAAVPYPVSPLYSPTKACSPVENDDSVTTTRPILHEN